MSVLVICILVFLLSLCILLDAVYQALPSQELRRRARLGQDKKAAAIYKISSYGATLRIFLWTVGVASATALIVWAPRWSWWLAVIVTLLIIWAVVIARPILGSSGLAWQAAALFAPVVSWLLEYLHPAVGRLGGKAKEPHTKLFEREDLVDLLKRQGGQSDSRITGEELKLAHGALTFGDKTAGTIMTPRQSVEWVSREESISPALMDELHKTSQIRFPVVAKDSKPANPDVVGTLNLRDLLNNLEKPGRVDTIMKQGAHFINESDNLRQVLDGFLKAGQHLLIVVNNFEEVVGVITLEDVLSQVLGQELATEFDNYHDKHAVAGHEPAKS